MNSADTRSDLANGIRHVHVDASEDTRTRLAAILRGDGIATVDGLPDRDRVRRFAHQTMRIYRHPDSEVDGLTILADRGVPVSSRPGKAGFGAGGLMPHTEQSGATVPPHLMLLVCARASLSGGSSLLVDGKRLYESIAADPSLLQLMQQRRSVSFRADGHVGSILERLGHDRLGIRLRLDGGAVFARPLAERLHDLREHVASSQRRLDLEPGQGYILDNRRWLHGRTAFVGSRLMFRVLGDPWPQCCLRPGFAAAPAPGPAT